MSVTIRAAAEKDHGRVAQIWFDGAQDASGGHAPAPELRDVLRARVPREIASGRWTLFVAENDGAVIGMLALSLGEKQLDQIFVAGAARSAGVGKALLDRAKAAMPDGFWLRTHDGNGRAHAFYEREGLRLARTVPHPDRPEQMYRVYEWPPR